MGRIRVLGNDGLCFDITHEQVKPLLAAVAEGALDGIDIEAATTLPEMVEERRRGGYGGRAAGAGAGASGSAGGGRGFARRRSLRRTVARGFDVEKQERHETRMREAEERAARAGEQRGYSETRPGVRSDAAVMKGIRNRADDKVLPPSAWRAAGGGGAARGTADTD